MRGDGVRASARPRSEPGGAAGSRAPFLARLDGRAVLRAPFDGDLLRPSRRASAARARSLLARLDQRRRSLVAERGGLHRWRDADVEKPRDVCARARRSHRDGAGTQRGRTGGRRRALRRARAASPARARRALGVGVSPGVRRRRVGRGAAGASRTRLAAGARSAAHRCPARGGQCRAIRARVGDRNRRCVARSDYGRHRRRPAAELWENPGCRRGAV